MEQALGRPMAPVELCPRCQRRKGMGGCLVGEPVSDGDGAWRRVECANIELRNLRTENAALRAVSITEAEREVTDAALVYFNTGPGFPYKESYLEADQRMRLALARVVELRAANVARVERQSETNERQP